MKSIVEYDNKNKPKIKRSDSFCSLLENKIPSHSSKFTDLLKYMDTEIKKEHPRVKGGALNNCHGDWYEWLISIFANNHIVQNRSEYVLLQLPNIIRFDVASLYEKKLFNRKR